MIQLERFNLGFSFFVNFAFRWLRQRDGKLLKDQKIHPSCPRIVFIESSILQRKQSPKKGPRHLQDIFSIYLPQGCFNTSAVRLKHMQKQQLSFLTSYSTYIISELMLESTWLGHTLKTIESQRQLPKFSVKGVIPLDNLSILSF